MDRWTGIGAFQHRLDQLPVVIEAAHRPSSNISTKPRSPSPARVFTHMVLCGPRHFEASPESRRRCSRRTTATHARLGTIPIRGAGCGGTAVQARPHRAVIRLAWVGE